MRGSKALLGETAQMSVGDIFSQSETIMTAVGKNPAERHNCAIYERKAKRWCRGIVGPICAVFQGSTRQVTQLGSMEFLPGEQCGQQEHWQKNLRIFPEEHKVGLWEILVKTVQSLETIRALTVVHSF